MRPPTIYSLCRPRQDVLAGRIRDEDFAADLSQVLKGTVPELYKDPALFFANTHPTRGLKELNPMRPPTIYDLCRPRQDVLAGRIRDEDFAADLSQVAKGEAPELYKDPALFFANTHPPVAPRI